MSSDGRSELSLSSKISSPVLTDSSDNKLVILQNTRDIELAYETHTTSLDEVWNMK